MSLRDQREVEITGVPQEPARQAVRVEGLRPLVGRAVPHAILLGYTVIALFPVFLIVINSFKSREAIFSVPFSLPTPETFDLVGYSTVFSRASFIQNFANSLIVTVVALVFILLTGAM